MYWANFLHLYQPADQIPEIFDRVVAESYRPLVQLLLDHPQVKITLNISGVLTRQLWQANHRDIVSGLATAANRGQIEFTERAMYHPLLPFLPADETIRQIRLNRDTNRKLLGSSYQPKGFFPPEMAYSPEILPILVKLGFEWIILDEIAFNGRVRQAARNCTYQIAATPLRVYFRERNPSNLIMTGLVRNNADLQEVMGDEFPQKHFLITGMDGETFGHHRPGLTELLVQLLTSTEFDHVFFSQLPGFFPKTTVVSPLVSTWASTEKDITEKRQFLTWKDPENPIHKLQWQFQKLVLDSVKKINTGTAREKLDRALASDQFFWASAKPWWSLEVIEHGAWQMLDTIRSLPRAQKALLIQAESLYHQIIACAFQWQRTGVVRKAYRNYRETPRVPFKERTIGAGEPWVYKAFIELLEQAMRQAAIKKNFEGAILWRDAIWKLDTQNDIYDAIHAVDLLRRQIPDSQVLAMIGKYRREYERHVSGQPEQRGT